MPFIAEQMHPPIDLSIHFIATKWKELIFLNPPPVSKILRGHFDLIFTNNHKSYIETRLPNLRYIYLERNLKDIAVSNYISEMTDCWHIRYRHDPMLHKIPEGHIERMSEKEFLEKDVPIDEKKLLSQYHTAQIQHGNWLNYLQGTPYLHLHFDELVQYPEVTTKRALEFLELPVPESIDITDRTFVWPMPQHPAKERLKTALIRLVQQ